MQIYISSCNNHIHFTEISISADHTLSSGRGMRKFEYSEETKECLRAGEYNHRPIKLTIRTEQ